MGQLDNPLETMKMLLLWCLHIFISFIVYQAFALLISTWNVIGYVSNLSFCWFWSWWDSTFVRGLSQTPKVLKFSRVCFLIWLPHHGVSQAEKNFCILHELGNRMQRVVLGGLIANPPKPPSHSLWHNRYFEYSTKVRVAVSVG